MRGVLPLLRAFYDREPPGRGLAPVWRRFPRPWHSGLRPTTYPERLQPASTSLYSARVGCPETRGWRRSFYCTRPGRTAVLAALAPGKMRISCRLGVAAEQRHAGLWRSRWTWSSRPVRLNLLPEGLRPNDTPGMEGLPPTAEGTQVVLENAALRACWRLEPEGLALACVENRLYGLLLAECGRCGTGSGLHGPAGRGNRNGRPGGRPVC